MKYNYYVVYSYKEWINENELRNIIDSTFVETPFIVKNQSDILKLKKHINEFTRKDVVIISWKKIK